MNGTRIGDVTLLDEVALPAPGWWFRTDGVVDGLPVWARMPRPDAFDDAVAIGTSWERLFHLDHPLIPRAVRFDPDTGAMLVAAPGGVPLLRLLEHRHEKRFPITPATVLELGRSLADAVVHAHERGRPHGHLSPEEVLLSADGRIVVWGFSSGPDARCSDRWQAPERARGQRASGDVDQWAIAALLASMITGRVPWRGDDPDTEARVGDTQHLHGPVMEQWPPLGRALRRALSNEPRDRFPSTHPLRQALDALRQRVPQKSDLPAMGAWLDERFGLPPYQPEEAVPAVDDDRPSDIPPSGDDLTEDSTGSEQDDVADAGAPPDAAVPEDLEDDATLDDTVDTPADDAPPSEPLAVSTGPRLRMPTDPSSPVPLAPQRPTVAVPGTPPPPPAGVRVVLPSTGSEGGFADAEDHGTTPTQVPDEGRAAAMRAGEPSPARSPADEGGDGAGATDAEETQPMAAMGGPSPTDAPAPEAEDVAWEDDAPPQAPEPVRIASTTLEAPPKGGWSLDGQAGFPASVPDASVPGIVMASRRVPEVPPGWWEPYAQPAARVMVPVAAIAFVLRWILPWLLG